MARRVQIPSGRFTRPLGPRSGAGGAEGRRAGEGRAVNHPLGPEDSSEAGPASVPPREAAGPLRLRAQEPRLSWAGVIFILPGAQGLPVTTSQLGAPSCCLGMAEYGGGEAGSPGERARTQSCGGTGGRGPPRTGSGGKWPWEVNTPGTLLSISRGWRGIWRVQSLWDPELGKIGSSHSQPERTCLASSSR